MMKSLKTLFAWKPHMKTVLSTFCIMVLTESCRVHASIAGPGDVGASSVTKRRLMAGADISGLELARAFCFVVRRSITTQENTRGAACKYGDARGRCMQIVGRHLAGCCDSRITWYYRRLPIEMDRRHILANKRFVCKVINFHRLIYMESGS